MIPPTILRRESALQEGAQEWMLVEFELLSFESKGNLKNSSIIGPTTLLLFSYKMLS